MQSITLQTSDTVVTSGDILGRVNYAASAEADGSAAILIAGSIYVQAEGSFQSSSNPAAIVFATAAADASSAVDRLKITDGGHLIPMSTETYDLGSSNLKFRNLTASSGLFDSLDMTPLGNGDQPAYQEGVVFYDSENHTLTLYNDEPDIALQIGQEQYIRVRNNTATTIENGTAVLINGVHGNAAPTISGAIASSEATSQVIGLATHSIEPNSFGYVTTYGIVRDVDTSAFSAGDELYLSATQIGSGVNTSPVIPNFKVTLGHVITSSSSNGSILVQIGNAKLGGGDVKSEGPLNVSGVPFITSTSDTTAGGSLTDPLFIFDSGNRQLQLASGVQLLDGVPSNTSNVLYNDGGELRFNGSAVGNIYTAGSGLSLVGTEFNVYGGSGNFRYAELTASDEVPTFKYLGSGVTDTPINLEVRSSFQSATGSGTALLFQGTQGQLFSITDNLSSGTIFNVSDITGLPMLEVTASGDVEIGEFADNITIHQPVLISGGVPSSTTNKLYNNAGTLYFNGIALGGPYDDTYVSGVATYASGQAIENETQISSVSGWAGANVTAAINNLVDGAPAALDTLNELAAAINDDASYAATITSALATKLENVVEDTTPQLGGTLDANGNTIDMGTNTITDTKVGQWDTAYGWGDHSTQGYLTADDDTYVSGVAVYASGQAIENEADIAYVSGVAVAAGGGTVQGTDGTYDIQPTNEGATTGNARGESSVDLQTDRSVATQVASATASTISGGSRNTASGACSTVSGGRCNTASGSWSTTSGGNSNTASSSYSTVAGGLSNAASGSVSTVGGGQSNTASGGRSAIGGGQGNTASGSCSTVSGGFFSTASANFSTVGGGAGNTASGLCSTVSGGYNNTASSSGSTVSGGSSNTASCIRSTVGGGDRNTASGYASTVGGGTLNTASANFSTVGGGVGNTASGTCSTVGGGVSNTAAGTNSTVTGGNKNYTNARHSIVGGHSNVIVSPTNECCSRGATVSGGIGHNSSGGTINPTTGDVSGTITCCNAGAFSTISGGCRNIATGYASSVGGGACNTTSGISSAISGGTCNTASGYASAASGGYGNTASSNYSTVSGGYSNTASATASVVSGGYNNTASGGCSSIGGGYNNAASNTWSTVGGGYGNISCGSVSTVGGGLDNTASSSQSFVGGGRLNTASALCSTVSGGASNTASGGKSTISGGTSNTASGEFATISGGGNNSVSGCYSTISGGSDSTVASSFSTLGGRGNYTNARYSVVAGHKNVIVSPTNECCSRGSTISGGIGHNSSGGTIDATTGDVSGTITCCNAGCFSTIGGGCRNIATGANSTVGGGSGNTVSAACSTVSGGNTNTASGSNAVIGGGGYNTASGSYSTVGGGGHSSSSFGNVASGSYSTVSGGVGNCASSSGSTISGGYFNAASGSRAYIGGGQDHVSSGYASTIVAGQNNCATANYSTVSGGLANTASGYSSTISGGKNNTASAFNSTVAGGRLNTASGRYSAVSGGWNNYTNARHSVVSGHSNVIVSPTNECCSRGATISGGIGHNSSGGTINATTGDITGTITCCNAGRFSTISGGCRNVATGLFSIVSGGGCNTASNSGSTVSGGACNGATGNYSTINGGFSNTASGACSTVGAGFCNIASCVGATVGGGMYNSATGNHSTVGGGGYTSTLGANTASGNYSTIAGGAANSTSGNDSTIGGGSSNFANQSYTTIAGGVSNCTTGAGATVGGGYGNYATGSYSVIAGGGTGFTASGNRACSNYSSILGGYCNVTSACVSSVVAGSYAKTTNYGEVAHAAGPFSDNTKATAQHSLLIARKETTDATANQVMFLDNSSARLTIPAETTWMFTIKLAAHNDTNNDGGWWYFRGGIARDGAGNTSLIGSVTSEYSVDSNISTATAEVVADDTNDALEIRVTGVASKSIRWVAVADISQVSWGTP